MAVFSRIVQSGTAATGRFVNITQTATAGNIIHTSHATALDEIWAWAQNTSVNDVLLTVEWGGVVDPDDLMNFVIPARTPPILIIPGLTLSGGLIARAFAATTAVINVGGHVNRIT
jgi:hypothetical protein